MADSDGLEVVWHGSMWRESTNPPRAPEPMRKPSSSMVAAALMVYPHSTLRELSDLTGYTDSLINTGLWTLGQQGRLGRKESEHAGINNRTGQPILEYWLLSTEQ